MKLTELKDKTPDQLNELVLSLKKELFNLRFQRATGEVANTSRVRVVRRTIARAKTLLRTPAGTPAKKAAKSKKAKG